MSHSTKMLPHLFLLFSFYFLLSCNKMAPALKQTDSIVKKGLLTNAAPLGGNFFNLTTQLDLYGGADIIQKTDGTLIAVLSNEPNYINPALHLFKCLSTDGGVHWTAPEEMCMPNPNGYNLMGVSLFAVGNRIFAVIERGPLSPGYEEIITAISHSDDNGVTWSPVVKMVGGDERPLQLSSARNITITHTGRILVPIGTLQNGGYTINTLYSDDNGLSWTEGANPIGYSGTPDAVLTEPTVAQLNDGRIMMLIRTQLGFIYKSYSSDNGVTWATPVPTTLENPWTAHAIRITKEGYIVIVYDNTPSIGYNGGWPRTNLSFAVSYDYGATWTDKSTIIDNSGAYMVMQPSILLMSDTILISFLHGAAPGDTINKDNAIKTALYRKSDILTSISPYIMEDWNSLGSWITSGSGTIAIVNGNNLHLTENSNGVTQVYKMQQLTTHYSLEYRAQVQAFVSPGYINTYSTFGTTFSDGSYRFMMKLESDGIYVLDYTGTWQQYAYQPYLNAKNAWHTWKAVVNNGTVSIYMDSLLAVPAYSIEATNYNTGKIEQWTGSGPTMPTSCYVDYIYFTPL